MGRGKATGGSGVSQMFQVKVEFGASTFVSDRLLSADPTSCKASGLVQRSLMKCC